MKELDIPKAALGRKIWSEPRTTEVDAITDIAISQSDIDLSSVSDDQPQALINQEACHPPSLTGVCCSSRLSTATDLLILRKSYLGA